MRKSGFSIVEILVTAVFLAMLGAALMKLIGNDTQSSRARSERFRASLAGRSVAEAIGGLSMARNLALLNSPPTFTDSGITYWDKTSTALAWLDEIEQSYRVKHIFLRQSLQNAPAAAVWRPFAAAPAIPNTSALKNSLRTIEVVVQYVGFNRGEVLVESTIKEVPPPACP